MEKNAQHINLSNSSNINYNNSSIDLIKTTNVNILLNRVRLDKKKIFKKKILFLSLLGTSIGFVVFFVTII